MCLCISTLLVRQNNALNKANLFYSLCAHIQGHLKLSICTWQYILCCEIGKRTSHFICQHFKRDLLVGQGMIPKNMFSYLSATAAILDIKSYPNMQQCNLWTVMMCLCENNQIESWQIRLRAKKGPAPPPPLGNFADISYLEENFKPHLLRDVCTLCFGALVSDSLLHMLL